MSSALQALLYDIVCQYCRMRNGSGVYPAIATELEIYNDVRKVISHALGEMVDNGTLTVSRNLNGLRLYAPSDVKNDVNIQ